MRFNFKTFFGGGAAVVVLWVLYYVMFTNHWDEPIIIDNPTVAVTLTKQKEHEDDVKDKGNEKWRRRVHYAFAKIKVTVDGAPVVDPATLSSSRVTIHYDQVPTTGPAERYDYSVLDWDWVNLDINFYGSIDVNSSPDKKMKWKKHEGIIESKVDMLRIAEVEYQVGGEMKNVCLSTTCKPPRDPKGDVRVYLCTSNNLTDCNK